MDSWVNGKMRSVAGLLLTLSILSALGAQTSKAPAGNIRFQHLSEGLSQHTVTCILQDRQGFLWFGTRNGLNKYDGAGFTVYEHDADDEHSLSHNYVQCILEDSRGNIWVGTMEGGLNLYDRDQDAFTHFKHQAFNPASLGDNWVNALYEDRHGNLWVGTENGGLNLMANPQGQFIRYLHNAGDPNSLAGNRIKVILEDQEGNLWIGMNGSGLDLFDHEKQQFIHFRYEETNQRSLNSNHILSGFKDSRGDIWLGTTEGLNLLTRQNGGIGFRRFAINNTDPAIAPHRTVLSVGEDGYGRIWIGIENGGLAIYDRQQDHFTHYLPDPLDPYSLGSNSIWSIFRDRQGSMWVGARNRGLSKWDSYESKFNHHTIAPSGDHLSNQDVMCFLEDRDGNLWIGADGGGLSFLDRKTGQYTHYIHDPQDDATLSRNAVVSLLEDSSGNIWIGTWEGGLNLFDKQSRSFKKYLPDPGDPFSISGNTVRAMIEDHEGKLWFGTRFGGLNIYDPENGSFTQVVQDARDPGSFGLKRIVDLLEDSRGDIWVGMEGGLAKVSRNEKEGATFVQYRHQPGEPGSLSSNWINTIFEDSCGRIWVGTWMGMNLLDEQGRFFRTYTKNDGLPDNVINGIEEDEEGFLWISTNQGISKFDPESGAFRNYTVRDGLQSTEFIRGAHMKTRAGELFFGGINGYNSFFPAGIQENPGIPPMYITQFRIYNELVKPGKGSPLHRHISETDHIRLSHDQNYFSFEFLALNYSQSSGAKYAFYLEGYDKDWNYPGSQNNAAYSNVPPGEYTFMVKSSDNDKPWPEEAVTLSILITPPWWASWWAYTSYALAALALLLWYRQNLIQRERLKSALQLEHLELLKMREVNELRTNFFTNISHEFRTPLTLILSPLRSMYAGTFRGDSRQQLRVMIRNAERLLRLINQLLDLSKLNAQTMRLAAAQADLVDFIKPIFASFESYAQRKKLRYHFHHPGESVLLYFDPDKLEKIITNLLSNAFKYTDEGEVRLSLRCLHFENEVQEEPLDIDHVEIAIADTGQGIPEDCLHSVFNRFYQVEHGRRRTPEGTGIGLSLTKELVELHRGRILVESREGEGSVFKVLLPLGRDHLKETEIVQAAKEQQQQKTEWHPDDLHFNYQSLPSVFPSTPEGKGALPLILIVEDHAEMRTYIRNQLTPNYRLLEAPDGKAGLEKCCEYAPDLVISDVMMPEMDGFEFCRALKTDERISHIPVILLTARANAEHQMEGLETGADDYLTKPFDPGILEARVKNLIRSRELLRRRFAGSRKLVLEPGEISLTSTDELFLKNVLRSIENNISNSEFSVEDLSRDAAMSRMHLYRKIKALTGQTVVQFVRTIRLKRAAQLLKQNQPNVSEVTYATGFNDLQYFRRCFRKQFGVSPSEYARENAPPRSSIQRK